MNKGHVYQTISGDAYLEKSLVIWILLEKLMQKHFDYLNTDYFRFL